MTHVACLVFSFVCGTCCVCSPPTPTQQRQILSIETFTPPGRGSLAAQCPPSWAGLVCPRNGRLLRHRLPEMWHHSTNILSDHLPYLLSITVEYLRFPYATQWSGEYLILTEIKQWTAVYLIVTAIKQWSSVYLILAVKKQWSSEYLILAESNGVHVPIYFYILAVIN